MKNKINAILSIVVLALFGLFAMASFGSTNTEIVVTECGSKPPFTGKLFIEVRYRDFLTDEGISAAGTIFLIHQIILDTATCEYKVESRKEISFETGFDGFYYYTTPTNFTHTNAGDLWRVEVIIPTAGHILGSRELQAAIYNQNNLIFKFYELPLL